MDSTVYTQALADLIHMIDMHWDELLVVNSFTWYDQEWDSPAGVYRYFEIACMVEGTCSLSLNGSAFQASKGQVYFSDISLPSRCQGQNYKMHFITLGTESDKLYRELQACFKGLSAGLQPEYSPDLEEYIVRFHMETSFCRPYSRLNAKCQLLGALTRLYRAVGEKGSEKSSLSLSPKNEQTAVKLVNYLNEHYSSEIRLEELASNFGHCSRTLNLLFRSATGTTIIHYLIRLRIEKAQRLLRLSSLEVTEIALETGFCDCQHFSRTFRKYSGMSPRQYRSQSLHQGSHLI